MAKKEIKEQNKDLEIHVVDLISRFDPSSTNKYTKFLTKILKKHLKEREEREMTRIIKLLSRNRNRIRRFEIPKGKNDLERVLINYLHDVYGNENMDTLISFHNHLMENRILGKDINSYETWEEIHKDVTIADLKVNEKLLKKEVKIIFENMDWLFLLPLTMESSLTYGAGTRWCTASKTNKEYFYRYSNNGVLCYAISKKTGDKYGLYYDKEQSEFSIWDVIDRRIDSLQSVIPVDILSNVYQLMKYSEKNYSFFSEDEKKKSELFWNQDKYNLAEVEPIPMEEPVMERDIDPGDETQYDNRLTYGDYFALQEESTTDIISDEECDQEF